MTSTEIIRQTFLDGVTISKNGEGDLKLEGDQVMVAKWLPEIRKDKDALLAALSLWQGKIESVPVVCRNCTRSEVIEIKGEPVAGCLYHVPSGEFSSGWRRVRASLKKCNFH